MAASTLSVRSAVCRAQRVAPIAGAAGPRAPFLGRHQRLPVRQVCQAPVQMLTAWHSDSSELKAKALGMLRAIFCWRPSSG